MTISRLTVPALVLTAGRASACTGAGTPPAHVTVDPAPWVLFQQDAGARQEVALVRADGSDLHAPLHDLGTSHQTNPDWSPDGTRFVFAMGDVEREGLWVADADGANARVLLDCDDDCRWLDDPDWSPDGTRVAYSCTEERDGLGWGTLETVDVMTGEVTVLRDLGTDQFSAGARWSPDGEWLVYELVHKVDPSVDADIDGVVLLAMRLRRPGLIERTLTSPWQFAATADWSPDGRTIVYCALPREGADNTDLYTVTVRGHRHTRLTRLARSGGYAAEPAWLPDGTGVLFSGRLAGAGSGEVLAVAADGGDVHPAFGDQTVYGRHPRVQPKGLNAAG